MSLHGPSLTLPLGLACDTPMDVANIRLETIVVYEIKMADAPSSPPISSAMAQWMGLPPGRGYAFEHINKPSTYPLRLLCISSSPCLVSCADCRPRLLHFWPFWLWLRLWLFSSRSRNGGGFVVLLLPILDLQWGGERQISLVGWSWLLCSGRGSSLLVVKTMGTLESCFRR